MSLNYETVQIKRTEGTIMSIYLKLEGIKTEDLITDLFLYVEDEVEKELVKMFESVLIRASMDAEFLKNNLHKFYKDTARFLKKENLYKNFSDFSYFIYKSFSQSSTNVNVLSAYQDLLLQQFAYLVPPGKVVYGITTSGELMITDEIYPYLDYPGYIIDEKNIRDKRQIEKLFKSYGYDKDVFSKFEEMASNERLLVNMFTEMTKFINEDTSGIFPEKLFMPSHGIPTTRKWKDSKIYKDLLQKRKYILPSDGITGVYKNAADIKSILFKEVFEDNQVYLLYKIENNNDEGFYGMYDIKDEFFYSIYKDSTAEAKYHTFIENFVLESYCYLTVDVEVDRKRNLSLSIVDNIEENNFHYPEQPVVQFMYKEKTTSSNDSNEKKLRNYNREKYKEETISINPYIRKLPEGAFASEEAINRAREFGYELEAGETFIRPFTRNTFKLK